MIELKKTIEIKLAIDIDDEVVSREDILRGFDAILEYTDGVYAWGEIIDDKVFLVANDEKCSGCNWHSDNLYLIASSEEEAKKLYKEYGGGLCGFCITDMLYKEGYKINR